MGSFKLKNMKKLTLIFAIVSICSLAKSQTVILKQEVDTSVINTIYKCHAYDPLTSQPIVAKNEKAKKEFVNDMVLDFLRRKSKDCAGSEAADKARKIAEDAIISKPINKVE